MAKNKSKRGANGDQSSGANDRIPASLKEFGQKAADLVQNPVARSVIAAGLVTAAAALTANQKVRDTARKTARDAADATEEAAANASRVGEALVTAAADTFRKLFNLDEGTGRASSGSTSGGGEQTLSTPARRTTKAKGGAKTGAKSASAGKSSAAKAPIKPKAAKPKAATAKGGGAKKGAGRKAPASTGGPGTQGGGA